VANAHRVAVLEQGMKWVDRKYTMRDMEFSALRNVSRDIIREAFGFPKPLLGSVDDVNRANAEAAEVLFGRWLLVPRLNRIRDALNHDLLPFFGPAAATGLEFDYEDPVPPDGESENAERDSRVNAVAQLVPLGFDAAEALEAFELPEIRFEKPEPPPQLAGPGAAGGNGAAPAQDGNSQQPTQPPE
jgi:phage portal protein BeeE